MRFIRVGLWAAAVLCAGAVCASSKGQAPQSPSKPAADRYAAEPTVIERNDREIVFAADGTGSEHQAIVLRVQTDAAVKDFSVVAFTFASASQRVDIDYIRVRHPDGSVVNTPTDEALEMPTEVMRQAPFYSDLKQKQLPVRGLHAGDRLEWSVRLVRTKAEAPGRFWGISTFTGKDRVALAETFTLSLPKAVPATVWSPKLPVKPVDEGNDRVYRWTASQLDPTAGPEAEARAEAEKKRPLTPEEIADRTDGALPLIAWSNFPDWASVGAWYRELEKDRVPPDAAIKAKAAELTAGKTTDEAKIRALYAYVSAQIRYIGVALGQGRYQPHLASEVLGNQYGDYKDKATLLASLLAATGYQADTVLIGPGIRFNEAVPMPADFNHAVTAVRLGTGSAEQTIWLDSTQEVAPYRALLFAIRDKQALRIPLDGIAHLDRTPADLPFPSSDQFKVTGAIDATGVAKGHFSVSFRGDDEIGLRAGVHQVSPAQYDQLAQYLLSSWGFGGKVTHAGFTSPTQTDEPIVMSFDYERDKPGNDWGNYRIVALDGPDELPIVDEKEPPKLPIELGTPRTMTSSSQLTLPQGWGATPPDAIHEKTPWVSFDRIYRVEHGTLFEERTIAILQRKVPVDSWRAYKKFTDAVGPGTYPYVQLTRDSKVADSPGPPSPTKNDPEAARLVDEATKASTDREFDRAADLLQKATAINDQQPYLWSVTGYRAMLKGEVSQAIDNYTRELGLHPNEANVYPLLANAQLAGGKRPDAEATLRHRLKTIGADANTSMQLASMLLEDEKPAAAVAVAEEASQATPDNLRLQWLLGRARLKAGQKAAGISTLLAALRETEDPGLRNDLAYELADNGMATPEVEAASRKAVDQLSEATAAWTLTTADQDIREMRSRASLLVASWDTLGWAIYESPTGHDPARLAEAESYLSAAWRNGLHAEVGLHLGELQEAQHHLAQALVTYQLADASTPRTDLRGVHQPPTPMQREITARIDRLKKTQQNAALKNPEQALANQLKLSAGPSNHDSLVAPYRILLTANGVQSIVAIDKVDGDHGHEDPALDLSRLKRALPEDLIPSNSNARLLRSAVLNCHQEICQVMLTPLAATR